MEEIDILIEKLMQDFRDRSEFIWSNADVELNSLEIRTKFKLGTCVAEWNNMVDKYQDVLTRYEVLDTTSPNVDYRQGCRKI